MSDRTVLDDGIRAVDSLLTWETEAFAPAPGYDDQSGRYLRLVIPHQDPVGQIFDQTLLMRPDLALAQRERNISRRPGGGTDGTGSSTGGDKTGKEIPSPLPPPPPLEGLKNTRFFGVARVRPDRYAYSLNQIMKEILQQLAAPEGVELEITARQPDGYSDDKVRNVAQNARTLKFETYGFEDR